MNAKEKAKELYLKYENKYFEGYMDSYRKKELSRLRTKEKIKNLSLISVDALICYAKTFGDVTDLDILYFENVKKEIQKL